MFLKEVPKMNCRALVKEMKARCRSIGQLNSASIDHAFHASGGLIILGYAQKTYFSR